MSKHTRWIKKAGKMIFNRRNVKFVENVGYNAGKGLLEGKSPVVALSESVFKEVTKKH